MIKRYVIIGLTVIFVLVSGVCYSCNYSKDKTLLLSGMESNTMSTEAGSNKSDSNNTNKSVPVSEGLPYESLINAKEAQDSAMITVHICGAVKQPGVYEVSDGSRLYDLINLSGGLDEEAAGDYINQAEKVTDGQRYYIPTIKELEDLPTLERIEGGISENKDNKNQFVNINTADANELMTLPGIGEAKAKSIIEYRNANGKFKSIEEIMNIPGIKEGLFNKIASKIVAK